MENGVGSIRASHHPKLTDLDLKEIKELIALMKKNDLSVFKMEKEGFKITLKKGVDFSPIPTNGHVTGHAPQVAVSATPAASAAPEPTEQESLREITSPMVGTFYGAPSPDAAPYV